MERDGHGSFSISGLAVEAYVLPIIILLYSLYTRNRTLNPEPPKPILSRWDPVLFGLRMQGVGLISETSGFMSFRVWGLGCRA